MFALVAKFHFTNIELNVWEQAAAVWVAVTAFRDVARRAPLERTSLTRASIRFSLYVYAVNNI